LTSEPTTPDPPPQKKRVLALIWLIGVNAVLTLVALELVLRAQQALGPLYNLSVDADETLWGISDELNHVYSPRATEWSADGIRDMREPNAARCQPKLLFMGDSFMQGLGIDDTIPVHVKRFFRDNLHRDICVDNAGASSYSPSIYVPQAKKLIPLLKPDVVIIDIDETDLYDDYYRYRNLVTRDQSGSVVAVRRTPLAEQFRRGLVDAAAKPFYVQRLIAKLYFTRMIYPKLSTDYRRGGPADGYFVSRGTAAEARAKYAVQIDYFETTLEDLTDTVITLMSGPQGLIYIHHPHLENLQTSGDTFNDIISASIRKVAARHGVRYYDATDELKAEFGASAPQYYIPNDVHFNERGLRAYGIDVAKYLAAAIPGG
jgi:hypothetical protein